MTIHEVQEEFKHLGKPEPMFTYGRLTEVDPEQGSATLNSYHDRQVPLRFDSGVAKDVVKLARKFVGVRGMGWYDDNDDWVVIVIEELEYPTEKPFDLDEFRSNPNPRLFDPDNIIRTLEPYDADEFNRFIKSLRRVGEN